MISPPSNSSIIIIHACGMWQGSRTVNLKKSKIPEMRTWSRSAINVIKMAMAGGNSTRFGWDGARHQRGPHCCATRQQSGRRLLAPCLLASWRGIRVWKRCAGGYDHVCLYLKRAHVPVPVPGGSIVQRELESMSSNRRIGFRILRPGCGST